MAHRLPLLKRFLLLSLGLGLLLTGLVATARAEVVNFKELLPFVEIKLPGWTLDGQPSGLTMREGDVMVSEARATYRAADKTLEVTVMDFLGKPFPFLGEGQLLELDSADEKVHSTTVQDFKAIESFRPREHHGELNIVVANRFWAKVDGDGIDSPEVLKAAAAQMDLKKLAALAK